MCGPCTSAKWLLLSGYRLGPQRRLGHTPLILQRPAELVLMAPGQAPKQRVEDASPMWLTQNCTSSPLPPPSHTARPRAEEQTPVCWRRLQSQCKACASREGPFSQSIIITGALPTSLHSPAYLPLMPAKLQPPFPKHHTRNLPFALTISEIYRLHLLFPRPKMPFLFPH